MAWLTGWPHRISHNLVAAAGAGTNYQIVIAVHSGAGSNDDYNVYLDGRCTDFPNDIRFTDNDGETELKYWGEDLTADPVIFHVKVADDLGSNQSIFVYCGNATGEGYGSTMSGFGDSITYGDYASDEAHRFLNLVCNNDKIDPYFWAVDNQAVEGIELADIADVQVYPDIVGVSGKSLALVGYNDMRHWGTDATAQSEFQKILYAVAAWLSIPSTNKKTGQGAGITYSGTWANTPVYGGGLGKYSQTQDDYVQFTVHGSTIYIGLTGTYTAQGGDYSITVDSVEKATGSCNLTKTPNSALSYAPFLVRIAGLSDDDHTVRITVTSAGSPQYIYFDWAAGNENTTNFFLGNCLHMLAASYGSGTPPFNNGSDTAVSQYNTKIAEVASVLSGDGLLVQYVDADSYYNLETDVYGDGYHPNDSGHQHIADAFIATIDTETLTIGPVATTSNGTDTFIQYHGAATTTYLDSLDLPGATNFRYRTKIKAGASGGQSILCGLANALAVADDFGALQAHAGNDLRYANAGNEGTPTAVNEVPWWGYATYVIGEILFLTGTKLQGFVDGDQIAGDISTNLPDEAMGLWLWVLEGDPTQDWSFIAKYVDPEPTHGAWGEWEEAAVTFELSVTELLEIGDSHLKSMLAGLLVTEGLITGDTLSPYGMLSKLDGLKAGDSPSLLTCLLASDGLKIGDTPLYNLLWFLSITDGAKFSDSNLLNFIIPLIVTDGTKLGDSLSILTKLAVSDGLELGDSPTRETIANLLRADGVELGDSATLVGALLYLAIVEGLKPGDTRLIGMQADVQASDGTKIGDSPLAGMLASLLRTDGVKVGDSVSRLVTMLLAATDGVKVGDAQLAEMIADILRADGVRLGDITVAGLTGIIYLSLIEAIKLGDARAIGGIGQLLRMWLRTQPYFDVTMEVKPYYDVSVETSLEEE